MFTLPISAKQREIANYEQRFNTTVGTYWYAADMEEELKQRIRKAMRDGKVDPELVGEDYTVIMISG